MRTEIVLPNHVIFRELPFCGVLLDTRSFQVYRLSQWAAATLRAVLRGPLVISPYESLIDATGPSDDEKSQRLLNELRIAGLIQDAG